MPKNYHHALMIGSICLASALTMACGGGSPIELTLVRQQTLYALPEGNFYFEAARLLPAPEKLFAIDQILSEADDTSPRLAHQLPALSAARIALETANYSDAERASWQLARDASDAKTAFELANKLPILHRYYLAGAVAFRQAQYDQALAYFEAIPALVAGGEFKAGAAADDRSLWAYYMIGLTHYAKNGLHPDAIKAFDRLRTLAADGADDPMGLAVTSLGEQARWVLRSDDSADGVEWSAAKRYATAAGLYGQQAAHQLRHQDRFTSAGQDASVSANPGDDAVVSLLFLARRIAQDRENLAPALQDPIVRKLMIAYAFTRAGEIARIDANPERSFAEAEDDYQAYEVARSNAGMDGQFVAENFVNQLAISLEKSGAPASTAFKDTGIDRLAATLYRAGKFDLASRYAAQSEAALAYWVRAKLALRAGDAKAATSAFAKAAEAFPADENWLTDGDWGQYSLACRVRAESATDALTRGDFLQAMDLFRAAGADYWNDYAYVAERVLSVDELKKYVDQYHPSPGDLDVETTDDTASRQNVPDASVRHLLARRLMRVGRYQEALGYFPVDEHAAAAKQYWESLQLADVRIGVQRAEALYAMARIAREDGIHLFAMELSPDNAVYGGSTRNYFPTDSGEYVEALDRPVQSGAQSLVSKQEQQRFLASAVDPVRVYSYRYRAAKLAEQAATAVPARSQAYAALLCEAVSWVNNDDPIEGTRLYKSYLRNGPFVPWGESFGIGCPAPEFDRAQALFELQRKQAIKRQIKRAAPFALGLLTLGFFWFAWRYWLRRRA
jgi:cellulose synthase operon protein C